MNSLITAYSVRIALLYKISLQRDSSELHRRTLSPFRDISDFSFGHTLSLSRSHTHSRWGGRVSTSPGCTLSLRLPRLLHLLLRYRAPAASSGSAPAGKPVPPATPAPPRPPPASDRDASFSGQEEPAAPAARLLSESHFREATKQMKEPRRPALTHTHKCVRSRRRWNTGYRARALSHTHSQLSQRLERFSDTPDSRGRVRAYVRMCLCVNQCVSPRVSWTLLEVWMGERGAPPADTHNCSTTGERNRTQQNRLE